MLYNGLLDLMNSSTCFGHYYAHRHELATIQMAPACGTSPWLWRVAGLVRGCRFERPGRGMLHMQQSSYWLGNRIIGFVFLFIHSFSNLSDDRSNASSKMVPPHSAI